MNQIYVCFLLLLSLLSFHCSEELSPPDATLGWEEEIVPEHRQERGTYSDSMPRAVRIADFFPVMDSISEAMDTLTGYSVHPHLLMRANGWILERLVHTDYYQMAARDSFVYDQSQEIVIREGEQLFIPGEKWGVQLSERIALTWIDINIPEYALRIMEGQREVMKISIRVGQNRKGYFADGDRLADLRTKTGTGKISGINYHPIFANPRTGARYETTRRDDGRRTLLPLIPSLDPEINGVCTGQLIHCTTNPETLGRAYSNGCIGVGEADMWRIFSRAPEGTFIRIRYDLQVEDESGEQILLPDVYGYSRAR